MEPNKHKCSTTWNKGLRHQNHAAMNVWVLNKPMVWFRHRKQKVITRPNRHANIKWIDSRLQLEIPKRFLGSLLPHSPPLSYWPPTNDCMGCGVHPPHVQTKVRCDKGLAILIWRSWATYAKAFKGAWDKHNWKNASMQTMQHQEIALIT